MGSIARYFPPHWRRATGYSLDQLLRPDAEFNPARLLVSSEGYAGHTARDHASGWCRGRRTGLVLLQFDELVASMAATPVILETDPSAVELMGRMLINLTRSQPGFARQISMIEGDPAAVLVVEYYGESETEVAQKAERLRRTSSPTAYAPPPIRWSCSIRRDRRTSGRSARPVWDS